MDKTSLALLPVFNILWSPEAVQTAKGQISQKVTLDNTGGKFFFFLPVSKSFTILPDTSHMKF